MGTEVEIKTETKVEMRTKAKAEIGIEAGMEAGTEAGTEAGMEAGTEAGMEAGMEAEVGMAPFMRKLWLYIISLRNADRKAFYGTRIDESIRKTLKKMTLIVLRVNRKGELTNSKPCADCAKEIKELGVKNIVYSIEGGAICQEKVKHLLSTHVSIGRKRDRVAYG